MAFMEFLQTPFAHEIMMAQGGFLTPHSGVNIDTYSDGTDAQPGRDPAERDHLPLRRIRPDARRRGPGAFWTGMVDFTGGADPPRMSRRDPGKLGRDVSKRRATRRPGPAARWPAPLSRRGA
jgi:hypothetical protein